jgi:hypothetical protein
VDVAVAAAAAAAAGDVNDAELLLVGCKVPPGCELTAVGSGLDPEPRWVDAKSWHLL